MQSTQQPIANLKSEFANNGVVKVTGLIPVHCTDKLREQARLTLEAAGAVANGQWCLSKSEMAGDFPPARSALQKALKKSTAKLIADLNRPEVIELASQLCGVELANPVDRPQLLFTPPNAKQWRIPGKVWHVDAPRLGRSGSPGVQMFTFVNRVLPGGGATVVAAGSHRYVNDQGFVKSKDVKQVLKDANPWFAGLFNPAGAEPAEYLDKATEDGDGELQVVELHGEPGDVYLMDLRVLHSLAPNVQSEPRLMVTQRYYAPDAIKALFGHSG